MAEIKTYACDECRVQKKETNHWWEVFRLPDTQGIAIFPFDGESFEGWVKVADLCGANCVAQYMSKNLQGASR